MLGDVVLNHRMGADGVDWDDRTKKSAVYLFDGKHWDDEVNGENGNYDYLMGADLDMSNPAVAEELDRWARWYLDTTCVDGFRLDAMKHIHFSFYIHWLSKLRRETGQGLPAVGEYWHQAAAWGRQAGLGCRRRGYR